MDKVQKLIVLSLTIALTSIFLSGVKNNAFAIEYTNYTSEKYGIQFKYPVDWSLSEKNSRFEEGGDIEFKSGTSQFSIFRYDDPIEAFGSSDLETATEDGLSGYINSMYEFDVRTIEDPSYITIDGQKAGTFLVTFKDKYDDFAVKGANQQWNIFVGDHVYQILNIEPTSSFDSPENTEIRNTFIKSINFLGDTQPIQKSRFD
jgi:hypothetical protein